MRNWLSKGYSWGVMAGVGGAFSIIAYNDDTPDFATVTVIAAVVVYLKVDRPRQQQR